jgi:DNA modification methylase
MDNQDLKTSIPDPFKTVDHINYALVPKTHTAMYLMHKWWARKPHNVVAEYIRHYSKEGEIVLDPFCGSGVTALEAVRLKRKIIASDLNPMAIFITEETLKPLDLDLFKSIFNELESKVQKEIDELYVTKCTKCKRQATITHVIWEMNKPVLIKYECHCRSDLQTKKPDKKDLALIKIIDATQLKYWYPKNKISEEGGATQAKSQGMSFYYELFTHRNLLAFARIFDEIQKVTDERVRSALKFTFTSSLAQGSKLVFVIEKRGRESGEVEESSDVGSWTINNYWVPPKHFEINAWRCFEERFNKVLKGKDESNRELGYYQEAKSLKDLQSEKTALIAVKSAMGLSHIPDNSVDYIFTDPPYGGSIPYSGLTEMWMGWLDFSIEYDKEITVNEKIGKGFDYYHQLLYVSFSEMFRVLKPEHYLTVTFHNTDIKVWNSIIRAVMTAGFHLEKIIYQPPARPSAKGLLHPYGTAVGDYYIRFYKGRTRVVVGEEMAQEKYKQIVVAEAKNIIARRGEPTAFTHILNSIYPALDKAGYRFKGGTATPDSVLREHIGKDFVLTPDNKWWLKDISAIEQTPLTERVEKAVVNVLNRKIIVSFDDVLQEIFFSFKNALTPETQSIQGVIAEYARKTPDGCWQLLPLFKFREDQHQTIINYLAELGQKGGFKIWAAHKNNETQKFSEEKLELQAEMGGLLDRLREIDVLWIKENQIKCVFEVENTTAILEAINRASNIPYSFKKFIVLPDEREEFLQKRLKDPLLREMMAKFDWAVIYYNALETFYNSHKKDKQVSPESVFSVAGKKIRTDKTGQLSLMQEE